MIFDQQLLDALEQLQVVEWEGEVWRVVVGDRDPLLPNRRGARWNPPETAALYSSLDRATVLAEMEHLMNLQIPPLARALFRLHRVRLGVEKMLDLRDLDLLEMLGVSQAELVADESAACRRVGGAAAWLGRDAILVPSARGEGENLVVFVDQQDPDALLEVIWSGPVEG